MLTTGSPAPEMVLADTTGRTVRLGDFRGRGAVLMYFLRSTTCPICTRHARELAARAEEYAAADVHVLLVVPEDRATAAAWRARHRIAYPVLTGPHGRPHGTVGLGRRVFGTMQQSGTLLVDTHGVVRHAHGATLPTAGYDRTGVTAAIAALRTPVGS
ncbi:peroxiredoxin family protein [Actinocatenispora rupis]|uniref:thioredoxin-dependent peroxiredoxin n=1 Tax=Actinocatenispora rupis TaxID=519421 RepID=A0A8J3JBL0_9ACTN|nr:redoxin domain-containing protein [Actinocatenispora rupis]GID15430.1 peroxiredoxin [Actinocatenispora rupis]